MKIEIDFAKPPTLGSVSAQEAYELTVRELADATPHKYTIAPQCKVFLPLRTLHAGDQLTLPDVGGSPAAIRKLEDDGVLIVLDDETVRARQRPPADRDRYRVDPSHPGSILSSRRVMCAGEWLATDGSDFELVPAQQEIQASPAHLSDSGRIIPAHAGRHAVPELTPLDQLRMLVDRGLIIDTRPDEPPPWAESLAGATRKSA